MSPISQPSQASQLSKQSIVFLHPDLGIGGAERLIIDAAVGLQKHGHKVTIFTSHRDVGHCFDEARDGTLDVRVRGNLLPATFGGRFKILLTILRQAHLILSISLFSNELASLQPTAFFIDQLSACIPLLRCLRPRIPILFYCHFPDLLLVQGRKSWVRRTWRLLPDALEGWGMSGCDRVLVNSKFTGGVVREVWGGRVGGKRGLGVVYPCVNILGAEGKGVEREENGLWGGKKVVLSINRFEKKKDVGLAVKAYAGLGKSDREGRRLVVAGGYDNRVGENVEYHRELVELAEDLGLRTATHRNVVTALSVPGEIDVIFLLSVPAQLKDMLLQHARLLVYTPSNEHFGIVPLEAMLAGVPVLAANSGGPLETVVDGETGWLRSVEDVQAWTDIMREVVDGRADGRLREMGRKGRGRVVKEFSAEKMAERLDEEVQSMVKLPRAEMAVELSDVLLGAGMLGVLVALLFAYSGWLK